MNGAVVVRVRVLVCISLAWLNVWVCRSVFGIIVWEMAELAVVDVNTRSVFEEGHDIDYRCEVMWGMYVGLNGRIKIEETVTMTKNAVTPVLSTVHCQRTGILWYEFWWSISAFPALWKHNLRLYPAVFLYSTVWTLNIFSHAVLRQYEYQNRW